MSEIEAILKNITPVYGDHHGSPQRRLGVLKVFIGELSVAYKKLKEENAELKLEIDKMNEEKETYHQFAIHCRDQVIEKCEKEIEELKEKLKSSEGKRCEWCMCCN